MAPAIPATTTDALNELKSYDPSYKELDDHTAKESITSLANSAKNNTTVEESISENLANPSTKDKIIQEIIELAKQQAQIEKLFKDVDDKLVKIDDLHVSSALRPNWLVLRTRYRKLVRDSKTKASELSSFSQSFAAVLIPSIIALKNDPDREKKVKEILDVYITEVDQRKNEAQAISDSFTTLKDDLHSYTNSFSDFAKSKKADLENQQTDLQNRLIELQGELKKYNTMITMFGITLGVSLFAGAIGGVLLFTPLAPFAIFVIGFSALAALGSLAGLIYALVEKNKTESEINSVNKQLEDIAAQLETIASASATLKTVSPQVESIIQSLEGFNKIWDWIVGELVKVKADTERAESFIKLAVALELQLTQIQNNWNSLAEVLDAYVANIISTDD